MAYAWSPRKLCQILSLSLLHVSFTFFRLVLHMLRERTDGLYIVRGKVSVRKIDESEDESEDIIEFTDVSDEEHDIDSDEEEYSGVSEVDYEDIVDEEDGECSEQNESEDNDDTEETDFEDNEDEEEDTVDFCDLLFLQNIRSSDISIGRR